MRVLVTPEDPLQMAQKPPPDDTDALLVLAALDAAFGAEHLAPWVSDAVVVLSVGGVPPSARLDVGREMLRQAGISLRSVILLGSDPQDESSGVLSPDDLRDSRRSPRPVAELGRAGGDRARRQGRQGRRPGSAGLRRVFAIWALLFSTRSPPYKGRSCRSRTGSPNS